MTIKSKKEVVQHIDALRKLCEKYHISEMYYFRPEKKGGLAHMGDAHFLILPQKDIMNEFDLYDLRQGIGKIIDGIAFVQLEEGMNAFLKQGMVTQEEYDAAMKKNKLVFLDASKISISQSDIKSKEIRQKKMLWIDAVTSHESPFFALSDSGDHYELRKKEESEQSQEIINTIYQQTSELDLAQKKELILLLAKNLLGNASPDKRNEITKEICSHILSLTDTLPSPKRL